MQRAGREGDDLAPTRGKPATMRRVAPGGVAPNPLLVGWDQVGGQQGVGAVVVSVVGEDFTHELVQEGVVVRTGFAELQIDVSERRGGVTGKVAGVVEQRIGDEVGNANTVKAGEFVLLLRGDAGDDNVGPLLDDLCEQLLGLNGAELRAEHR